MRDSTSRGLLCHTACKVSSVTQQTKVFCVKRQTMPVVSHSRQCRLRHADNVCCFAQQGHMEENPVERRRCLLCEAAGIVGRAGQQTSCASSHSRQCQLHGPADNACCVTLQTVPVVSHSRRCLLPDKTDIVCPTKRQMMLSHSRQCLPGQPADNACCNTQQTHSTA